MRFITKTILVLSMVSLFTDMASEMLYPVMPVYLKHIGFSVFAIGVLEGFAEAIAGLSKGFFGNFSDKTGKRLPFVRFGYSLSALSKPMTALFIFPAWIFFCRFMDRLGKGLRTAPRDAMLALETTKENKAKVFGFHRAFDTLGAAIGPMVALIWLTYRPEDYQGVFLIAFIPGIAASVSTLFLKEEQGKNRASSRPSFLEFMKYWRRSDQLYRKLVAGLLVFTFINSSDVFLLLMLKEKGLSDQYILLVYIFYNLVYACFSYPAGHLADRIGLKTIFMIGLILFGLVYISIPFVTDLPAALVIFFIYGIYAACSEGVSKAWISNITGTENQGTAIGFYTSMQSLFTIAASSITGFLWDAFTPELPFIITGVSAILIFAYFQIAVRYSK